MMFTTVRGRFGSFEGAIDLNADDPLSSSVEGSVDVNSISSNDDDRDTHLRSPDFFDVDTYPKITFHSSRVERVGDDHYKVYGDLTIRDAKREIVWDVVDAGQGKDPWGNQRRAMNANTSISRKDFGITWNVGLETGGWLVGDKINMSVELQLVQVVDTEAVA